MDRIDFFLGANSAEGFASLFNELYNEQSKEVVILKGGSGTGKSTLMKKIAEKEMLNGIIERIHCSSDPESLDAVIFNNGEYCIADGTSPHTLDPVWPGAVETLVNLGECWDREILKNNKDKIIELVKRKKRVYAGVYKLLKVAGESEKELKRRYISSINEEKAEALNKKILNKIPQKEGRGKSCKRLLSGITPDGYICYYNTVKTLCDNVINLEDSFNISSEILKGLGEKIQNRGVDVIYCVSPLHPDEVEHLIMPTLRLAITKNMPNSEFDDLSLQNLSLNNFVDKKDAIFYKARSVFEKKAIRELINEACKKLGEARELHSLIEEIYISAMDFDKINEKGKKVLEIFNLPIDK